MARKPQNQQPQPNEAVVKDSNTSASPVTKPEAQPVKVIELPNGTIMKTY